MPRPTYLLPRSIAGSPRAFGADPARTISTRLWRVLILLLIASLSLAACADDDPDHLRAQGAAVVVLEDGTETGISLEDYTRLDDDRVSPLDGRLAGHCTIGVGEEGFHDVLHVALTRTSDPDASDLGLRSIELRLDTATSGTIEANLGGTRFSAESGAECSLSRPYIEQQDGLAAVMADCILKTDDGATATAMVDLQLVGCDVEP